MDMYYGPGSEGRRMIFEQTRMTAEKEYLKNPTDTDNLTKWGESLLELSLYGSDKTVDKSREMLREAVSKLEEALTINPAKHEALWCLGNAHTYCGFFTGDYGKAKILFDEAFQCFQKAVDESPESEHYLRSLAECAKAPSLHREIHGGPAATSNASDMNAPGLKKHIFLEHSRMTAERDYLKNPTDSEYLNKMYVEAVSKVEEALTINPVMHEALWCLGNAHTANAFMTSNHDEAKIRFDEAFQCYQKAVDESPENKHYLRSLADCVKSPESEHYLRSLAECAKAPSLHREIHGGPAATSNASDMNAPGLKKHIFLEHSRMTAERDYLKNPTDSEYLNKMYVEAVSKVEEALTINPVMHEALWCLGNAHTANAFMTSNHDEAKIRFDEAFQCYQKAVDESPENKHYLRSLADCVKAPALHKEIFGVLAETSNAIDMNATKLDRRMFFQDARMTAERDYLKNPTDTDNLRKWGGALLQLFQYETMDESKKMFIEAVSKLEEALTINRAKHEALWCLGNAHTYCGFFTTDYGEAKILFDVAFQCFQKAVDEPPESEHYLRSLADCVKAPSLHREIHGGPAATSNATDMNAPGFKRRIFFEHTRMTAERDYLKNPTDTDNLTKWGGSLLELSLSLDIPIDDSRKMLREAVSKLEEALTINPVKHEALWCLGNACIVCGFLTSDYDEAKLLFDEAFRCFQKAVDESPENKHYLRSLAECAKAPELHRDIHAPELKGRMFLEHVRMTAERDYLKNPTDTDNLTKWGGSLLQLSQYETIGESRKMLREAVAKLEEALTINPAKHEALICLGTVHIANGFLTSNHDEAKILFDKAFQCFQKAVDESPENEHYLRLLAECAKEPVLHREIYGGPAATSNVTCSAKVKNDLCGWAILALGFLIWIGMVILLMDKN